VKGIYNIQNSNLLLKIIMKLFQPLMKLMPL